MADNRVLIEVVSQSEGLDETNAKLQQLSQREKELIAQMDSLSKQKQQWQGSAQVVAAFDKEIENANTELKSTRKSMEDLSKATKQMPMQAAAEATTKSLRAQRQELMNMLANWSDFSESGQKAYKDTMDKAGKLDDKMRDLQGQIRFMGSDTAAFDAILEGTQLVAGGFSVAQGAAALFGNESEDLQKMMVKLQAAMAISVGLQQVVNTLQKESNIITGLSVIQTKAKAAAEALATKGTIAATVAQKALNLVAKANPYVLLAIGIATVVGALYAYVSGANAVKKEQEKLNFEISNTEKQIKSIEDNADFDASIAEAAGKSWEEIHKLRLEAARAANDLAFLKVDQVISNPNATKEQRDEAVKMEQETYDKVKKLLDEGTIYQIKKNKEAADKKLDDSKKAAEKAAADAKSAREKRDAEIKQAEKDLQDEKIKAMQDGLEKEIASIELERDRKLAEIKGNSQAEIDLRAQLEANAQSEIKKVKNDYEIKRKKSEIETEIAITNARLAEVVKGSDAELALRRQLLEEKSKLDRSEVENSTNSEEWKAAKIKEINANLNKDLHDLSLEYIKTADERSKGEVLIVTQQYEQGKISRHEYEKQLRDISIQSLQDEIAERKAAGQNTVDLEKELSEKRIAIAEKEAEQRKQLFSAIYSTIGEIANTFMDMNKQRLEQEMADFEHYYTTDREAAKKNKDMKLISEEEFARKQLEIKRKQAKADKEQALFNAIISTAQAVASALTTQPFWLGLVLAALAAAMGAVQIAKISSQPLPKYWKGRRNGKGEYAMVGEYGPELMWIPTMATIMPEHETRRALTGDGKAFDRWNMPRIEPNYPQTPRVSQQLINQYYQNHRNEDRVSIDYERLGKSVAKYMKFPKQKDITINWDKSGLAVTEGNTTSKVLNAKYSANV